MKVFVVMGHDLPQAVFSTAALADRYVKSRQAQEKPGKPPARARVNWRVYEFSVDATTA